MCLHSWSPIGSRPSQALRAWLRTRRGAEGVDARAAEHKLFALLEGVGSQVKPRTGRVRPAQRAPGTIELRARDSAK